MSNDTWTTRRLIRWMSGHFESKQVDAPRVVAEMLLSHVIACDRMRLYMEADRPAAPHEREALRELVRRAGEHEPVQYLVGKASFYGMELAVDDSTLIPQPCTEDLVTAVLEHLKVRDAGDHPWSPSDPDSRTRDVPAPRIADIGTGSGCIAVAIARHRRDARLLATDIEPRAIELARHNAVRAGVNDRVAFAVGAGLGPLGDRAPDSGQGGAVAHPVAFDVICSNPPYIPDAEWNDDDAVQHSVRTYVPERATRGGADGLDVIRPLLEGCAAHLVPGGLVIVEIADSRRDAVLEIARAADGLVDAEILRDSEGYWRFVRAVRAER